MRIPRLRAPLGLTAHGLALLAIAAPTSLGTSPLTRQGVQQQTSQAPAPLLPTPQMVQRAEGFLRWSEDLFIRYATRDAPEARERSLRPVALVLAEEVELLTGRRPQVVAALPAEAHVAIRLEFETPATGLVSSEENETHGYELEVSTQGVQLRAAYSKGVAHGVATLLQLMEPVDGEARLPCLLIRDAPLQPYRSVMVDVARQPHGIPVLEDVIRLAHLYKIRYVQLHLTDNQHFTFPFSPITGSLQNNHCYTAAELKGLVADADARGVTLIPEIDLPGHSRRLIESGYLPGAKGDRDVAAPQHHAAIHRLLDEVMEVFASSPYLHVGGDESGAGDRLLPFLGSMQDHVRQRGRRLIVWEGFHGAPVEVLPATGEDRVLVAAWESSYNPPWNLLGAGYQIINASWKPLYVVGGDSLVHPGSTGGRMWSPETLAAWHKDEFQHWEPGRPVFEDRGPGDEDRGDSAWTVPAEWREQVLGAQISVWEQEESSLVRDLRWRLPVLAERLWSGTKVDAQTLLQNARSVDRRVFAVVQPVQIDPLPEGMGPVGLLYRALPPAEGAAPGVEASRAGAKDSEADAAAAARVPPNPMVQLRNRSRLGGQIRYTVRPFQGSFTWIRFPRPEDPASSGAGLEYLEPFSIANGGTVRARLLRPDGTPVGGGTWARYLDWPARVSVTEYDLGRRRPDAVPDLAALPEERVLRRYTLPFLRGPLGSGGVVGQRFAARLQVPGEGEYQLSLKTQSGRATLYLDLDRDGAWSTGERLIVDTPDSEELITVPVRLDSRAPYRLRIDHASGLPRPVVLAYLQGPGIDKREELSPYLLVD